jgi:hypothetical protein
MLQTKITAKSCFEERSTGQNCPEVSESLASDLDYDLDYEHEGSFFTTYQAKSERSHRHGECYKKKAITYPSVENFEC